MTDSTAEKKARLKPGMHCDMIIHKDWIVEKADVRKSVVYDVEASTLILSQTNPPLGNAFFQKSMDITFLDKQNDVPIRLGFEARFTDILKDYQLASTEPVVALVMERQDPARDLFTYDLRMCYRVKPGIESGMTLFIQDRRATLIDVSAGGLCFHDPIAPPLKAGEHLTFCMVIDGERYNIKGKIVRSFSRRNAGNRVLAYTCIEFIHPGNRFAKLLNKKNLDIERRQLSHGRL